MEMQKVSVAQVLGSSFLLLTPGWVRKTTNILRTLFAWRMALIPRESQQRSNAVWLSNNTTGRIHSPFKNGCLARLTHGDYLPSVENLLPFCDCGRGSTACKRARGSATGSGGLRERARRGTHIWVYVWVYSHETTHWAWGFLISSI